MIIDKVINMFCYCGILYGVMVYIAVIVAGCSRSDSGSKFQEEHLPCTCSRVLPNNYITTLQVWHTTIEFQYEIKFHLTYGYDCVPTMVYCIEADSQTFYSWDKPSVRESGVLEFTDIKTNKNYMMDFVKAVITMVSVVEKPYTPSIIKIREYAKQWGANRKRCPVESNHWWKDKAGASDFYCPSWVN